MKPTLLVLAAGMGSRYGGLKQIDGFGQNNEAILEYSVYDAIRAGFGKVVFVIRKSFEQEFKEKFANTFQNKIQVEYVFQEKEIEIDGKKYGQDREKPRGTGHAMLVAKEKINEPFAVINADDYYGISGYSQIVEYFKANISENKCCIVGYILEKTLSESGTVNRGVCHVSEKNTLIDIKEMLKISKKSNEVALDQEGNEILLQSVVSMNFWGFNPEIFTSLEENFHDFVLANQGEKKTEFYIPSFIDMLIKEGKIACDVLQSQDARCGVTYQEDKPEVQKTFENLIAKGSYPKLLR